MVLSISFSFPSTNIFVNIFYVGGCIAWSLCSQIAWIWTLSPLMLHYETLDNLLNLTGPQLFHTTCSKHPRMFGRGCHHKAVQRVRWACPLGVHHPEGSWNCIDGCVVCPRCINHPQNHGGRQNKHVVFTHADAGLAGIWMIYVRLGLVSHRSLGSPHPPWTNIYLQDVLLAKGRNARRQAQLCRSVPSLSCHIL